jgi:hypothetical protein
MAMLVLAVLALSVLTGPVGGEAVAYRVWNNSAAADENPAVVYASSPSEWEQMWLRTGQAPPPFNDRGTVGVGIFLGERDGRRHIQVVGAVQRGQRIVVTYEEIVDVPPSRGLTGGMAKTRAAPAPASEARSAPWAIISVDRVDLPISIEQRVRD